MTAISSRSASFTAVVSEPHMNRQTVSVGSDAGLVGVVDDAGLLRDNDVRLLAPARPAATARHPVRVL